MLRQRAAGDLRLHRARRRLRVHASAATARRSSWVDLVPGQADRSEERRSVHRDARHEDEVSDHGGAVGGAGAAASGRRDRDASRGDRGVEHADDPEPEHEHCRRQGCRPAATGPLWAQFYPQQDRAVRPEDSRRGAGRRLHGDRGHRRSAGVVLRAHRAESESRRQPAAGAGRGGAAAAPGQSAGRALYRVSTTRLWYTWQYLDEIRKIVKVPMLVKGILTAEDARLCVEHGMDGIIVSNHGGRSMDYGPSTLEVLPEIVAAVNGRVPGHHRQRIPPRHRHSQGARARRQARCCSGGRRAGRSARSARRACSGCWRSCSGNWSMPRRPPDAPRWRRSTEHRQDALSRERGGIFEDALVQIKQENRWEDSRATRVFTGPENARDRTGCERGSLVDRRPRDVVRTRLRFTNNHRSRARHTQRTAGETNARAGARLT